jgi:hypothetical protein
MPVLIEWIYRGEWGVRKMSDAKIIVGDQFWNEAEMDHVWWEGVKEPDCLAGVSGKTAYHTRDRLKMITFDFSFRSSWVGLVAVQIKMKLAIRLQVEIPSTKCHWNALRRYANAEIVNDTLITWTLNTKPLFDRSGRSHPWWKLTYWKRHLNNIRV